MGGGVDLETVNFLETKDLDISIILPACLRSSDNTTESAQQPHFERCVFCSVFLFLVFVS